jgi:hypothetical protein
MSLALRTARAGLPHVLPALGFLAFLRTADAGPYDPEMAKIAWTVTPETPSRVLSGSTERHIYQVRAMKGELEILARDYDLEIAYYTDSRAAVDTLTWFPLTWNADTGNAEILVGPDASAALSLSPGAIYRAIRTVTRPRRIIPLPLLAVVDPRG